MNPAFGHSPPPRRKLTQCLFAVQAVADQITADRGSRPTDPTAAMEIDLATRRQTLIDLVEDGFHQLGRGQPKIPDPKTIMLDLNVIDS
jgi:hypothetical protein